MRRGPILATALAVVLSGCGVTAKASGASHAAHPGPIEPGHTITASVTAGSTSALKPLAVDPVSPSLVYAVAMSSSGITSLTSHNGGTTWSASGKFSGSSPVGLQYVNAEDGFAVGPQSLWSTQNGGKVWHRENKLGLTHVHFVTATKGFAMAASQSAVVETINGGAAWQNILTPAGVTFSDISVVTPTVIYAMGGTTTGPALYRSSNGGQSWTLLFDSVKAAAVAPSYQAYLQAMAFRTTSLPQFKNGGQVDFTSPTSGWIAIFSGSFLSQAVLHTTNGGQSWHYVWGNSGCAMGCNSMGGGLYPAQFLGANAVWRYDGTHIDVSTTTGSTWQQSESLPFSLPPSQAVTDFSMLTTKIGWLTTDAGIYQTLNGGLVWKRQWPHVPTSASHISMRASGYGWMVSQTLPHTLWVTHDGGKTWAALASRFSSIHALDLWSSRTGLVVSLRGTSALTQTGGSEWSPITWPSSLTTGLDQASQIQFVSANRGWATTYSNQLLATTDGGQHWKQLAKFSQGADSIDFLNAQDGWALIGHKTPKLPPRQWNETLMKTTDGGVHWTAMGTIPFGIASLSFISMHQGWLMTSQGLWNTSNGGSTWSAVHLPHVNPSSIDATNSHTLYLTTLGGRLLKSQNQGAGWTTLVP